MSYADEVIIVLRTPERNSPDAEVYGSTNDLIELAA